MSQLGGFVVRELGSVVAMIFFPCLSASEDKGLVLWHGFVILVKPVGHGLVGSTEQGQLVLSSLQLNAKKKHLINLKICCLNNVTLSRNVFKVS